MTGVETMQPIVLQPMWMTISVQLLTLFIAAGVSYGMTKARLSSNERDIVALTAQIVKIETDFQKWQRERFSTVVTMSRCGEMQTNCKSTIIEKIDKLSTKVEVFVTATAAYNATVISNDHRLAIVIGAICQKLEIPLPELK